MYTSFIFSCKYKFLFVLVTNKGESPKIKYFFLYLYHQSVLIALELFNLNFKKYQTNNVNYPLSILSSNLILKVFVCNSSEIFVVLSPLGKLQAKYCTCLSDSEWISHCCVLMYSSHPPHSVSEQCVTLGLFWSGHGLIFVSLVPCSHLPLKQVREREACGLRKAFTPFPSVTQLLNQTFLVAAPLNLSPLCNCCTIPQMHKIQDKVPAAF